MTGESDPFVAHSLRTSLYFPQTHLFVAGNPKAAGTSLRWWLLKTHGVDVETRIANSLWGESAPYQAVWDDTAELEFTWKHLSDRDKADALDSAEVLTIKPVRHPVTRAFSAWAGKYLTLEPYYSERLPPSFEPPPTTIESADHITQLFDSFVASLQQVTRQNSTWQGIDVHLWPQHRLLARGIAGEEFTLRMEAMGSGMARIMLQLKEHGIDAQPMPRLNENVLPYKHQFVSERAHESIAALYAADFERFGYSTELPKGSSQEPDLPWLNDLRGRNRRYQVIHEVATRNRDRVIELNRELVDARRRERELLDSRSWKLTRPLRAVSGRIKRDTTTD